jgi:putative alpha-1,2-mannosidase
MSGPRFRRVVVLAWLPAVLFCVGCSKGNHVSGKVTFKGEPIPNGMIYFSPDKSKGGSGPVGQAKIENGQYNTADGGLPTGKGTVIVAITASEPATTPDKYGELVGKPLFPKYETTLDVTGNMTKDFDVPADAAKPKAGGGGKVDP